jgi:hypothetical protein
VDVSAGSKVLISTRIKALLAGGHEVEVGLPSAADSVRMLLSAAGVAGGGDEPSGVREIVDLCGRLPLALGIAGRLAASLGLVDSQTWSGMIGVLKEELRESHSGGTEEGMIRASLRGLKGSAEEQANVRSLLLLFALVPEDTHCPLEVLLLMFIAVNQSSQATIMHIRKWLRILINRSLVLGTIDRPSVHDLVLDFAVAQHHGDALHESHRAVVEAFRAVRPADVHGRRKFDNMQKDDPVSAYVCQEIAHHVSHGWQTDKDQDELATLSWLTDVPQDDIVVAASRVFGAERLSKMASAAESSRDWWLAARYWGAKQCAMPPGLLSGVEPTLKAIEAMDALDAISESDGDMQDFLLAQACFLASVPPSPDLLARPALVERVLASKAASRDPVQVGTILQAARVIPNMFAARVEATGRSILEVTLFFVNAGKSDPDPVMRSKCLVSAFNFAHWAAPMWQHPDFSWERVYGADGATLMAAFDAYDYVKHHRFLIRNGAGDWFIWSAVPCLPLPLHWGDMVTTNKNMDRSFEIIRRIIAEADYALEVGGIIVGIPLWSTLIWSLRLPADRRQAMVSLLAVCQLSWDQLEATVDDAVETLSWLRPRGDKTADGSMPITAEAFCTTIKCSYILMASDPRVSDEEIMQSLPTVEQVVESECAMPGVGNIISMSHILWNSFLSCAAVCEKLGRYDEALSYTAAGLVPDSTKVGTTLVLTRVLLLSIQARALVALGRKADAGIIFEAAIDEAHRYGLFLYEAFALRDLKVCLLDEMAHGEHGSRRLGVALRQLTGPAEMLTPLLDGLDAAEMMAMGDPDPGYQVVFEVEDPALAELRHELEPMRVMALQKRAETAGIDRDQIEEAMDSDAPKKGLVALLLAQCADAGVAEGERQTKLRTELEELRLTALQRKAAEGGIGEAQIDDALDSRDAKSALIELLLALGDPDPGCAVAFEVEDPALAELRQELEPMRVMALQKRAETAGIDRDQIEEAMDSDAPKEGLVTLLLAQCADAGAAGGERQDKDAAGALLHIPEPQPAELLRSAPRPARQLEPEPETAALQSTAVRAHISAEPQKPGTQDPAEDLAVATLRAELQSQRLMSLHKRAGQEGILALSIEDAMNSGAPKEELISLLIEHHKFAANADNKRKQTLCDELKQLKLMALHKRAMDHEIGDVAIEDAMDSDDPKGALLELILQQPALARTSGLDKPHFGENKRPTAQPAPEHTPAHYASTKHVMLSYNWDHQTKVTRVHDMLTKFGVKCWMDIHGGMGKDIFDSMASAVSNASAVVCFMSQAYQESSNCMLEVKFAKQSGVEIIPAMMEDGGWRASGWLGLLTAGSLWVRLSDESDESGFENNVRQLHVQIVKVTGAVVPADLDVVETDEGAASPTEAKEELKRLRDLLQEKENSRDAATSALADPSQPAMLPAGVPTLPTKFQSTEQIRELARLVLSTAAADTRMPRVGFFGMGGIGE